MNLLSVDPGLTHTGYAIFEIEPVPKRHGLPKYESITLKFYDAISPKKKYPIPKKLHDIYFTLFDVIHNHQITDIALETPFLGKNAQSFLKLGYIRGLLLLLAEVHGLAVHEFPPQVVKKAVTGNGFSDKQAVFEAVQRVFPYLEEPKLYDISDAIAVGICAYRLF